MEKIRLLFRPLFLPTRASIGLLVLRVIVGAAFMHHGYSKIQNPFGWMGPDASYPAFLIALAALSEFGGGLAWILGLLTPLASFGIACTMAVATHMHMVVAGDPFVSQTGGRSYELAAVFFAVAVLMLLAGPGRLSMDRMIFGERQQG